MSWFTWALLSASFAGLTAVLAKAGTRDIDSNLATALRTTVVLVLVWLVVWMTKRPAQQQLTARPVAFLVLSGLATGASWLCYFRALQLGKAAQVAPVDKLSVLVAMLLAAIFLGEKLTYLHWVGGSLIAAGVIILALN